MRSQKLLLGIMCVTLLAGTFSCIHAGNQPGATEVVFNRRFIPSLKPGMTYDQIAKLAGAAGSKMGEDNSAKPAILQYRWRGGRNSALTARFRENKMVDATVLAPNGHVYQVQNNGQTVDITK